MVKMEKEKRKIWKGEKRLNDYIDDNILFRNKFTSFITVMLFLSSICGHYYLYYLLVTPLINDAGQAMFLGYLGLFVTAFVMLFEFMLSARIIAYLDPDPEYVDCNNCDHHFHRKEFVIEKIPGMVTYGSTMKVSGIICQCCPSCNEVINSYGGEW
jgi:hypothetical protein